MSEKIVETLRSALRLSEFLGTNSRLSKDIVDCLSDLEKKRVDNLVQRGKDVASKQDNRHSDIVS